MGKKSGSGPTILVVDDDQDLLDLASFVLKREGYDVVAAKDAFEGLVQIWQTRPVIALLDVMMPRMSGLEMLTQLRAQDNEIPVIIMTADTTPEVALAALRDHACDFLAKPFDPQQLIAAVDTAFELRRQNLTIEVLSARPDWIELCVPCDPAAIEPLERLLTQIKTDLPPEMRESIIYAFREMLRNAIEHGGKNDPTQKVEVSYLRTSRFILYRIKDPGEGFSFDALALPFGSTVAGADGDPTAHIRARAEAGLRPGGFGILIARNMVDEVTYSERQNEVILIKYLDQQTTSPPARHARAEGNQV